MAPHVIEKAGHGGREKRSALRGSISRPDGRREQTSGRWAVSLAGAAGTAHVTSSERQKGLVARHVVCSATRGSEDLGPNRKSQLRLHLHHLRRGHSPLADAVPTGRERTCRIRVRVIRCCDGPNTPGRPRCSHCPSGPEYSCSHEIPRSRPRQ